MNADSDSSPSANKLMDGRSLARQLLTRAATKVQKIRAASGVTPCLATVLVGNDPASIVYTRMKHRRCVDVGIHAKSVEMPASTSTDSLVDRIRELAADAAIHGILVQHPVPKPIDKRAVFEAIPIQKDVDSVASATLGRVILGMPAFASCTPVGIMRLLQEYGVEVDGAHAVVIGRSPILGRPMASLLINAHATVTLCHSRTRNLSDIVRHADVLIAAVGKARFVRGDWLKPGVVVVDAGYNEGNVGDVDFESASRVARLITPVPGGVGPMTIAALVDHTVSAAAQQLGVVLP